MCPQKGIKKTINIICLTYRDIGKVEKKKKKEKGAYEKLMRVTKTL